MPVLDNSIGSHGNLLCMVDASTHNFGNSYRITTYVRDSYFGSTSVSIGHVKNWKVRVAETRGAYATAACLRARKVSGRPIPRSIEIDHP
jgi:hypothetical protein